MSLSQEIAVPVRNTWWRFSSSLALAGVVVALAHLHRIPVRVIAPPAMFRSGLAQRLAVHFTRDTGYVVEIDSIGSLNVRDRLEKGGIDILFSHDEAGRRAFERDALRSAPLFSADFVLVGPSSDPATVRTSSSAMEAFQRIAKARALYEASPFGSAAAAIEAKLTQGTRTPSEVATVEEALVVASRTSAYMLIDRPSYERLHDGPPLTILFSGDPIFADRYTASEMNADAGHRHCGRAFWHWLYSPNGAAAMKTASR